MDERCGDGTRNNPDDRLRARTPRDGAHLRADDDWHVFRHGDAEGDVRRFRRRRSRGGTRVVEARRVPR